MDQDRKTLRHSAAHLAAHALSELFPNALLTIGPATDEGFFYDILIDPTLKQEDLAVLQERMLSLADQNIPLEHYEVSKDEARRLFAHNPFKLELIDHLTQDSVGITKQGTFIDLCKGGHVASTGLLKHVLLTGLSGSYWRADKHNQALQRISGVAFFSAQELQDYIAKKEQAALYDHRKLGKQMDLFSFHPEGPGFPFYHPKGRRITTILIDYLKELLIKQGYDEISTPLMLNDDLWRCSGHYEHYKDNMYFCVIDKRSFAIRPMNCPGSIIIYKERPRSYRELPMRLAEFGLVHRHELSGVLHGLFRTRAFTIDDAHIYCMPEQIEQEIGNMIQLTYQVLKRFDFSKIDVAVSTRPENAMGSDALWERATNSLIDSLNAHNIAYKIQEGEGAFYGPKIEFKIHDSLEREWQCGTIQLDFFQPENFDLSYINAQGLKERPVMIHRAIIGSVERFFGIVLEHYKGNLPFFLAPVQVSILSVTDEQHAYGQDLLKRCEQNGLRVVLDASHQPLSGKIKDAQEQKIPYMIIIGKKESAQHTLSLRLRDGTQRLGISFEELMQECK